MKDDSPKTMLGRLRREIHIHAVRPETLSDPRTISRCLAILDEDERSRYERFYFDKDRHLFLAAHALVRISLSRYAALPPEAWRFEAAEFGRPEIIGQEGVPLGLRYNLSHTHGLTAVLINLRLDAGVDVEGMDRVRDPLHLAESVFSPLEQDALRQQSEAEKRRRFFRYWTLKEAYIKARGMGLRLPLKDFSFLLDHGETIGIRFSPGFEDTPVGWRFIQWQVGAHHMMAAAVRGWEGPLAWVRESVTL